MARRHGQSAMEYLMTYGWAILVIVIVAAVLFMLGVLKPGSSTAPSLIFSPGSSAYSFRLANGTAAFELDFGQAYGYNALITHVGCSGSDTPELRQLDNPVLIPSGEHRWILGGDSGNILDCRNETEGQYEPRATGTGMRYRGSVCIQMSDVETGAVHTTCGDLNTKFEPGYTGTVPTPGGSGTPTPEPISGGNPPVDSTNACCSMNTLIDTNNPFTASGTLTTCQVYSACSANFKMKVFREVGEDLVFVDESELQGISEGLNTFPCTMEVQAGDYIAFWTDNNCPRYLEGGGLLYLREGDITTTTPKSEWNPAEPYRFSIYADNVGGVPEPTPLECLVPEPTQSPVNTPKTVVNNLEGQPNSGASMNEPQRWAQSLTGLERVTQVRIKTRAAEGSGMLYAQVYALGDTGSPSMEPGCNYPAVALGSSGSVLISSESMAEYAIDLDSGLLNPEAIYSVVFWGSGGNIQLYGSGGNPYPEGNAFYSSDGTTWNIMDVDTTLDVAGTGPGAEPTPTPTPILIASGLSNPYGIAVDETYVYWAEEGGFIRKVAKDGSCSGDGCTTLASGIEMPYDLAVDGNYVYWIELIGNKVRKVPKDGSCSGDGCTTLASVNGNPTDIAIDSSYVYWTEQNGNVVRKVAKDGSCSGDGCTTLASSLTYAYGIEVDSTDVYWAEFTGNKVRKVPKDGSCSGDGCTTLASSLNWPLYVAVDGAYIYWTEFSTDAIRKVAKDGSCSGDGCTTLAIGLNTPYGIAIDATSVYWTELDGGVARLVPKDGSCSGDGCTILATGLNNPTGIALDGDYVYIADMLNGAIKKVPKP